MPEKIFLKFLMIYLAASKKYIHLCTAKQNFKTQMTRIQLHIKNANWFSPKGDYTMSGAGAAVE